MHVLIITEEIFLHYHWNALNFIHIRIYIYVYINLLMSAYKDLNLNNKKRNFQMSEL